MSGYAQEPPETPAPSHTGRLRRWHTARCSNWTIFGPSGLMLLCVRRALDFGYADNMALPAAGFLEIVMQLRERNPHARRPLARISQVA